MPEPEPNALLDRFFTSQTPDVVNPNTDIENDRRSELTKRIREDYIDLINNYGKSRGRALEVTPYPNLPNLKFKYFTITSSRNCPEITIEDPNNKNVSLKVTLESDEYVDNVVRKYYDPSKLTSIFPEDTLELKFWAHGVASAWGLSYRNKNFWIYPEQIYKYDSEVSHMRMQDEEIKGVTEHSEDRSLSLGELESLIVLVPILRERYETIRVRSSQLESAQTSVKQLPSPIGRFLGLFQRGRS